MWLCIGLPLCFFTGTATGVVILYCNCVCVVDMLNSRFTVHLIVSLCCDVWWVRKLDFCNMVVLEILLCYAWCAKGDKIVSRVGSIARVYLGWSCNLMVQVPGNMKTNISFQCHYINSTILCRCCVVLISKFFQLWVFPMYVGRLLRNSPVRTRRRFNAEATSSQLFWRWIEVETTLCAYW